MSERAHQPWWRAAGWPWVLLLAGPIIGTVCFFVLYLVAEASCSPAVGLLDPPVLRTVIILTGAMSLVALGGYAWRAGRAGRAWRLGDEARSPTGNSAVENLRFMVFVALLLLTMFAVFVIFLVAPVFGGSMC